MNNSHTLKGLESQLARLESDLATCKSIIREKNIELFEFSLTNIVFISSFLCLTIIVIFLVVYTYLRYGDKKQ